MEGAIIGLLGSILVVLIGGFSALWYRRGKLEGRMSGLEWQMGELRGRMTALEGRMAGIEGRLNHIETVLKER